MYIDAKLHDKQEVFCEYNHDVIICVFAKYSTIEMT